MSDNKNTDENLFFQTKAEQQTEEEQEKKQNRKKNMMMLFSVFAFVLIVFGGFYAYTAFEKNKNFRYTVYNSGIVEPKTADEEFEYAMNLATERKNPKEAVILFRRMAEGFFSCLFIRKTANEKIVKKKKKTYYD